MENNEIKICYCSIDIESSKQITASMLRGYLGYNFIQDTEFHHHEENPYHYPLIQYRRFPNKLMVIGINNFATSVFKNMSTLEYIVTSNEKIKILSMKFNTIIHKIISKATQYKFKTPWIALNQKNYKLYNETSPKLKTSFLENILVGNCLTMLRGIDINIDFPLLVDLKKYHTQNITVHNNQFHAFHGEFVINITLPKFIGIGKSVSKGFGVIEEI